MNHVYTINGRPCGFNVSDPTTFKAAVYKSEQPAPTIYDYLTFKAGSTVDTTWDPAFNCAKTYVNSYQEDLNTSVQTSIKATSGDSMRINIVAGNTYMLYWSEDDITSTKNYDPSSWAKYAVAGFWEYVTASYISEIYSLDFWHKPKWNSINFNSVTTIPQIAANLHRADALTNISDLFKNAPLTCNIIPFIEALISVAPNLTTTSGCFSGCTTAPDYAAALAQYPGWF